MTTGHPGAVLLDTCAAIWLANGDPLAANALTAVMDAGRRGGIFVSPISAWEIGMLSRPKLGRDSGIRFLPDPKSWFARFTAGPGIRIAAFDSDIAIAASWLPGEMHGDPGDRLIVATARHLGLPIITRDRRIIGYGETGEVSVIVC